MGSIRQILEQDTFPTRLVRENGAGFNCPEEDVRKWLWQLLFWLEATEKQRYGFKEFAGNYFSDWDPREQTLADVIRQAKADLSADELATVCSDINALILETPFKLEYVRDITRWFKDEAEAQLWLTKALNYLRGH